MSPRTNIRLHEVSFCADVKSWADALFAAHPEWPFSRATIEEYGASDMFHPNAVAYRAGKDTRQLDYASPEQAALVAELGRLGIHGQVNVPRTTGECKNCLVQLESRLAKAQAFFTELATSRTGTQSLQEKTVALLLFWYTHGKANE